jgi:hypothetical protein
LLRSTRATVIRSACSRSVKPVANAADVATARSATLIESALVIIAFLPAPWVRFVEPSVTRRAQASEKSHEYTRRPERRRAFSP